MLIELLLAILIGVGIGTLTGLIPGVHINLVGSILLGLVSAGFLAGVEPIVLACFIIALAITHTFVDFVPSIFVGCPDVGTELATLPGYELLQKGFGYQAVKATVLGGLLGILVFVGVSVSSAQIIESTYFLLRPFVGLLLVLFCIALLAQEKNLRAVWVFLLTGLLGFLVFQTKMSEPLLPLLSGLFGISGLLMSLNEKSNIPLQNPSEKLPTSFGKPILGATIASPLSIFLPAVGSGQLALFGNFIARSSERTSFLVLVGAINVLTMCFSFIALILVNKTRTGSAVAVQELLGTSVQNMLLLIVAIIIISGFFSAWITLVLAKGATKIFPKLSYKKISLSIIGLVIVMSLIMSGPLGLFVLLVSSATGFYCISLGVRRTNMMGSLLLPTIILYLSMTF